MSGVISPYTLGLALQAATPAAGYNLVNGTGVILSWTAPSDGKLHRATFFASEFITVTEVGGAINVNWALPNGNTSPFPQLLSGSQAAGFNNTLVPLEVIVGSGAIVTIQQGSALTVGAAVLWAEIWGS